MQALLLLFCLACVHCQFSYMIGPSSYLDVVRPPSGSYSSSRDANTTDEALQQQGRSLLQATRFQKPYNVCVSDWLPMVMCKHDDDHTTFTGEAFAAAYGVAGCSAKLALLRLACMPFVLGPAACLLLLILCLPSLAMSLYHIPALMMLMKCVPAGCQVELCSCMLLGCLPC